MTDFPTGRAWIELDREALGHNAAYLTSLLPPGCALMPAVKANAYGHGAVLVARELFALGIKAFCVASAAEGAELREHGVEGDILVLGYTHPACFPALEAYRLTQTVVDCAYALELGQYGKPLEVHVKLDTGMHRLGERCERLRELQAIFAVPNLRVTGAYTHLCADETDSPAGRAFTLAQGRAFHNAVARLRARGCVIPKAHILASDGLLRYPELGGDCARTGIALYGTLGTRTDLEKYGGCLRPVLSLKARITVVKDVFQGEGAGYALRFRAARDTRLAAAAIGYGDGLPGALGCGVGAALVNGVRAPIAGRVCMDQVLLDVTEVPRVSPGDTAVFIGRDGGGEITAVDVAEQAGTIANEILSRLGARLERVMVGLQQRALQPEGDALLNNLSCLPLSGGGALFGHDQNSFSHQIASHNRVCGGGKRQTRDSGWTK